MSERQEFKGNYLGFTYNGRHSSTFGIVRTSDGSRFNENLLPTMQDKTVQVPGGDGMYYFGSYYTQRQFSVSFAFDGLTDGDIAELKRHFGDKKIHDLIFDETPYKVWSAKVTGTATLKYMMFEEDDGTRIYKGEGSLQFTCYNPFARCYSTKKSDYKNLEIYKDLSDEEKEMAIDQWWTASRIQEDRLLNFGDVPTPFLIVSEYSNGVVRIDDEIAFSWNLPSGIVGKISDNKYYIGIDTKTGLAKRYVQINENRADPTGEILNRYCQGNLLTKLPVGKRIGKRMSEPSLSVDITCLYI